MIKKEKYGFLKVAIVAAFMMFLIMLPSMIRNHGIFIIRGDYVDQYIPRLIKAKEVLSSGAGTWDWFNFLGGAYNKTDVLLSLNSVCLLFPQDLIPYAVTYTHILRIALVAISSYAYFKYMVKEEKNAFLGALLYTFSSYTFVSFEFMQFIEALWSFPLILLSAEKMFRDDAYKHELILSVFLSCLINLYFFVFSTFSFIVYFFCRFFLSEEWKPKRNAKFFFITVLEYFIGILCAFFVFAPFMYRLFNSGSTDSIGADRNPLYLLIDRGFVARIFSFFVPAASNRFNAFGYSAWHTRATYIPVFGISFVTAYILTKDSEKWLKVLCLLGVLMIISPLICYAFNIFTSKYTRHAYSVILFMTLATILFLENYNGKTAKRCAYLTIGLYIALLGIYYVADSMLGKNAFFHSILHGMEREKDTEKFFRLYTIIVSAVMYFCLIGFLHFKFIQKRIIPIIIVLITVYGCSYTIVNLKGEHLLDYYPETKVELKEQVDKYFVNKPVIDDNEAYRIDFSKQWRNYSYTMGKPSISVFESVKNQYTNEASDYLGMWNSRVTVFPDSPDNATRTLLGAKYYFDISPKDNLQIPDGFSFLETQHGIDMYKNENFIGMGFSYDNYITRSEFEKIAKTKDNYSSLMLNTLVVEDEDVDFVSDLLKPYEEGYVCSDRISLSNFEINSEGFTSTFSSPKEEIVYVSVPYETNGWTAEINGKKADFIKANVGFIAFKTEKGENTISFKYKSPAFDLGLYVSCFGWLVLVVYLIINRKIKSRNAHSENNNTYAVL